jgi:hypothetical protein
VYHTNKERNPKEVRPSLPQRAKDFLPKLRKITVIGVESITTVLSLGLHNVRISEDVSFEETDDKFTVFFSRTANVVSDTLNFTICEELSHLLEVDIMMLSSCISHNVEHLCRLFKHRGIEEIPVDNDVDRSWLQAMLQANDPVVSKPPARSLRAFMRSTRAAQATEWIANPPSYPPPPPPPGYEANNSSTQSSSRPLGTRFSSVGVSGQRPALAVPMGGIGKSGDQMVPGAPGILVLPLFLNFDEPPTSTDDRDLVRVMGENYVRSVSLL